MMKPNVLSKRRFLPCLLAWLPLSVVCCVVGMLGCRPRPTLDWNDVKQSIRSEFPDVRRLSTEELANWLADESRTAPILLDARTADEFAVSHLRDARLAPDVNAALAAISDEPPETPIVVYCSVGYRSSQLAQELQSRGFSNVFNLEGSIFRWANEGRPVYQDGIEVRKVHPYNATWGQLLDDSLHCDVSRRG